MEGSGVVGPRATVLLATVVAVVLLVGLVPPTAAQVPDDTVAIAAGESPSRGDVAVAVSQASPVDRVDEVIIARDDAFADALSSGGLQAASPLLLVPSRGPVPRAVADEIRRLGATSATILGGAVAVGAEVDAELAGLGLATSRVAGLDRFATAAAAAASAAGDATTAILVRGHGGDANQTFADSLAAGGLAARTGWPVLLTATESLTAVTAEHLGLSHVEHVVVVGGPAAVSRQVEADLRALGVTSERLAGADRFATAVALAGVTGPGGSSAADDDHVLVVDGVGADAWAGGFAAANRSAVLGAPILLAAPDDLTEPTRAFLAARAAEAPDDPASGRADEPVLSCVRLGSSCEQARRSLGRPPAVVVTTDPPEHEPLAPGQTVQVTVDGAAEGPAAIAGDCVVPATVEHTAGRPVPVAVVPAPVPRPCTVIVTVALSGTTDQTTTVTFNDRPRSFTLAATGDLLIHTDVTARARQADGRIDFAPLLAEVAPVLGAADVGLCHLEVPLTTDHGDLSGYPLFNAPAELATGIAATGWDVCSTASNHTLDQGLRGVGSTLDVLDAAGVEHTGSARSAEEAGPLLRDVAGVRVGFLSATYGTNGIPVPGDAPWSVDLIDPAAIASRASAARAAGAEVVVLSLHWGEEYAHAPSAYQARTAEAVTRDGLVDLVVGHHAHVVQPVVDVHDVPVAFGLGNFLSGQFQTVDRSDGVILQAAFQETGPGDWAVDVDWTPTRVDPATHHVRLLDDPQTPADQASAARTDAHMTWTG